MNIHVHIERLVLDGLPKTADHGAAIQTAIETELSQLLRANGLRGIARNTLSNLSGAQIHLPRDNPPAQTGNQIARAVCAGLNSLRTTPRPIQDGTRRKA